MKSIRIVDLLGTDIAISAEDGQRVADLALEALRAGEIVEFDFTDMAVVVTSFLNNAIGSLLEDFTPEQLEGRLRHRGATADLLKRVRLVMTNASRYYHDPDFRRAVDASVSEDEPAYP